MTDYEFEKLEVGMNVYYDNELCVVHLKDTENCYLCLVAKRCGFYGLNSRYLKDVKLTSKTQSIIDKKILQELLSETVVKRNNKQL